MCPKRSDRASSKRSLKEFNTLGYDGTLQFLVSNCPHCTCPSSRTLALLLNLQVQSDMTDNYNTDVSRAKRQKLSPTNEMDPQSNPYLAHRYDYQSSNGFVNGSTATSGSGPLSDFVRHKTTASAATSVEEGPSNPFTSKPLSSRYFDILRSRRNLPVHAQRYHFIDLT